MWPTTYCVLSTTLLDPIVKTFGSSIKMTYGQKPVVPKNAEVGDLTSVGYNQGR